MDLSPPQPPPPAQRLGRRTYIVDRRFQLKYTGMLAVLGTLISLLFGGMMFLAVRDTEQQLLATGKLPPDLLQQTDMLVWLMVGISVLMGIALALLGVLVTHRVAGPIYVMSHYISVLARGRYPIMRPLRRSDELKDFFQRFQGAIDTLRGREVEEAATIEHALVQFAPLAQSEETKQALEALRQMHDRKRDATDRVDIGPSSVKNAA